MIDPLIFGALTCYLVLRGETLSLQLCRIHDHSCHGLPAHAGVCRSVRRVAGLVQGFQSIIPDKNEARQEVSPEWSGIHFLHASHSTQEMEWDA